MPSRDQLPGLSAHQEARTLGRGQPGQQNLLVPTCSRLCSLAWGACAHGALPSPQGGAHCTRGPRSRAADSGLLGAVCGCPATAFSCHASPQPRDRERNTLSCSCLGHQGWAGVWQVLLWPHPGAPQWCPLVPPTPWGRSANLAGTRLEGAGPGLRWLCLRGAPVGPSPAGNAIGAPPGAQERAGVRQAEPRASRGEGGGHPPAEPQAAHAILEPFSVLRSEHLWGEQGTRIT